MGKEKNIHHHESKKEDSGSDFSQSQMEERGKAPSDNAAIGKNFRNFHFPAFRHIVMMYQTEEKDAQNSQKHISPAHGDSPGCQGIPGAEQDQKQCRCRCRQAKKKMNAVAHPFPHNTGASTKKADKGKNTKAEDNDA